MSSQGPLMPRRRLGAELRVLRERAGMHLEGAAKHLECSISKVSRLETGQGIPKTRDVRDLLSLYGVDDPRTRDRLLRWAGEGRRQGWWQHISKAVPDNLETYISLEMEASALSSYVGFAVHGLVQTESYARVVYQSAFPDADEDTLEELVQIRLNRQAHLLEREVPLKLRLVHDESALYRVVGSRAIMRAQLQAVQEFSEQPNVSIRVFPFSAGPHLATQCSYGIFQFDEDIDRGVVNVELSGGDSWLELESEVDKYQRLFNNLFRKCPDNDECRALIHRVMRQEYP